MKLSVTKTFNLTYEHFENVIVTALEGGSNYWYIINADEFKKYLPQIAGTFNALTERISKALYENSKFKMNVYDQETDELLGTVTQESMIKAFKIASDKYSHNFNNILSDDYDADDADVLFQLAVMGEVVFG